MFSIGLRGRFGSYDHRELALARQKQDFGNILTRIRTTSPDEASINLLSAGQSQDHGSTSQTALESRQAGIPLVRLDSSGAPSRQDAPSSADLSGIDKTRQLVKLILDSDYIKRNLVASEFLTLTEVEFQDVLNEAAAILRDKKISRDKASANYSKCNYLLMGVALLAITYLSMFHVIDDRNCWWDRLNWETERSVADRLFMFFQIIGITLFSISTMHFNGYAHARDALASRGREIRELRNQFQEFCASIRESGLRRVCCTDTLCSISKESITRFFTYAGLAGAFVVGTGIVGIAPYLDASNGADEAVRLWSGNHGPANDSMSQQGSDVLWWAHFSSIYLCNLGVPLVFMASIFSGLKQDITEAFCGARYRNERVQDTVHNLRALLTRLFQDDDMEKFAEDLMHQKYIGSPELMLMDYASKMELNADQLEMNGVTQDVLGQHGLERTDLDVFCSEAKQVMDALPDRTIHPAEALKLINDLRFDGSFRNKVLNGLKFEDATYNDVWVRFVGGARALTRLGLGWLTMSSLTETFSSNMTVRYYRNEAGIAVNTPLTCELFANKTIPPFDTTRFYVGTASAAAQGVALSNAVMTTLDTGWIMLTVGCSLVAARARILPRLKATTACGKIRELVFMRPNAEIFVSALTSFAVTGAYVHSWSYCQNTSNAIILKECPHLSIPTPPTIDELRGFRSSIPAVACMAFALPLPLIDDWTCILRKLPCYDFADGGEDSDTEKLLDVSSETETALDLRSIGAE